MIIRGVLHYLKLRYGRGRVVVATVALLFLVVSVVTVTSVGHADEPAIVEPGVGLDPTDAEPPSGGADDEDPDQDTGASDDPAQPEAVPGDGECWQDFCDSYPPAGGGGFQSSHISYDDQGRLRYAVDADGNRIPDFSFAGYQYGEAPIPDVPVVDTLTPTGGDNTGRIQEALDRIGDRNPDANGHRGTLLLAPGRFEIRGTVQIRDSGVVLRGSGDGADAAEDTILVAQGDKPHQRTAVVLGSNEGNPWSTGRAVDITTRFVGVGSTSFEVADPSAFDVGQEVMVTHPSSQQWIDAVDGGGVINDSEWKAGSIDLRWVRRITRIDGDRLHLDAPIFNHLDRSLTTSTVAPVTERRLVTESGVEDLRVDIATAGGDDENHAWNAIGVVGAEDSWVTGVSTLHFGYAGVRTSGAIRITISDARATEPVAQRTGARMYNFSADGFSQLVLFSDCHAAQGRHAFVSNGTSSVSGVVWHRCTMDGGDAEAHRRWSTGLLFDNIREVSGGNLAKLMNRGDAGTSHGWGAAHSVIWGFNKEVVVQQPPTAQNYVVSTEGAKRDRSFNPGRDGSIEIGSGSLTPESLYEAQVVDRLRNT
jgi:hypothetical protein